MEIVCPACNARFALRTEKRPKTTFRVACGKCKHQFAVDPNAVGSDRDTLASPMERHFPPPPVSSATPPGQSSLSPVLSPPPPRAAAPPPVPREAAPPPPPFAAPREAVPLMATPALRDSPPPVPAGAGPSRAMAPPPPPAAMAAPEAAHGAPVEEFSEDLRLALLCDDSPERREVLCGALRLLGFKPHTAPSAREAMSWIYQNKYEVLLVHEDFGGQSLDDNETLAGLRKMQMTVRRHICVGLVSRSVRTMDNAAAFHLSVNFVMNERDLGRAQSLVRSALADNDGFYRVYKEVMRQLGKI